MIVEVNGKKYEPIEQPKRKPLPKFAQMALIMSGVYGIGMGGHKKQPSINADYVKEYGLIKNKQSKLPRSNREYIVWYFEKHFKILEP